MVDINWTCEAEIWLKDIFDYIALDNKRMARKVAMQIYQKVQILQTFPKNRLHLRKCK